MKSLLEEFYYLMCQYHHKNFIKRYKKIEKHKNLFKHYKNKHDKLLNGECNKDVV